MHIIPLTLLMILLTAVTGCSDNTGSTASEKFTATDITNAGIGGDFQLTDHNGNSKSLSSFKGKAVAVFFGYTHCPDICPTALSELGYTLKELGPDANRVQVLFVTLDPQRDTKEVLAKYVPAFHPDFLGLRGDKETTATVAAKFKIHFETHGTDSSGSYPMDHTSAVYVFDRQGRARLYMGGGRTVKNMIHDFRVLLQEH